MSDLVNEMFSRLKIIHIPVKFFQKKVFCFMKILRYVMSVNKQPRFFQGRISALDGETSKTSKYQHLTESFRSAVNYDNALSGVAEQLNVFI